MWSMSSIPNPNEDKIVSEPPSDAISLLRFSPVNDFFVIGTWSSEVKCYKVDNQGNTKMVAQQKHNRAVLCVCWDKDGENIFSGGCDNTIRVWNCRSNSFNTVGTHNASISTIDYSRDKNVLISGSWDSSISYWDIRLAQKIGTVPIKSKVYCMSCGGDFLVIGHGGQLAQNQTVSCFDLRKPNQLFKEKETPLKYQIRCLDVFPTNNGFAAASIEGRVAIEYINESDKKKNFSFKCHRQPKYANNEEGDQDVYAVNAIRFHKQSGIFASAGSDGQINFWDKEAKQRLKHYKRMTLPITSVDFNYNGRIMAYTTSYDWSLGYQGMNNDLNKPQIYLHGITDEEVRKSANNNNSSNTGNRR